MSKEVIKASTFQWRVGCAIASGKSTKLFDVMECKQNVQNYLLMGRRRVNFHELSKAFSKLATIFSVFISFPKKELHEPHLPIRSMKLSYSIASHEMRPLIVSVKSSSNKTFHRYCLFPINHQPNRLTHDFQQFFYGETKAIYKDLIEFIETLKSLVHIKRD